MLAVGPEIVARGGFPTTPLREIMPAEPTGSIVERPYRAEITELGRKHPVTRNLEGATGPQGSPVWSPWFRQIAALKPFAAIQGSQDQLFTMFDQEIGAASIEFGSFTRAYAESRNPNIEIADPTEGQGIAANYACITAGSRNRALAEAWINLHLSPECQLEYAKAIY